MHLGLRTLATIKVNTLVFYWGGGQSQRSKVIFREDKLSVWPTWTSLWWPPGWPFTNGPEPDTPRPFPTHFPLVLPSPGSCLFSFVSLTLTHYLSLFMLIFQGAARISRPPVCSAPVCSAAVQLGAHAHCIRLTVCCGCLPVSPPADPQTEQS